MNYIYKTLKIESEFEKDLGNLQAIKNIYWAPLDIRNFLTALILCRTYNVPFYNSLHAGIAINLDGLIISENKNFDIISGLKRISLTQF